MGVRCYKKIKSSVGECRGGAGDVGLTRYGGDVNGVEDVDCKRVTGMWKAGSEGGVVKVELWGADEVVCRYLMWG